MPISVMANKIAEGIFYSQEEKKSGHSDALTKDNIKDVLHNIANPYMILRGTHDGSFSAIYSIIAEDGNPMLIALSTNKEMPNQTIVNRISSIYGKALDSIERWIDKGMLLYLDDTIEPPEVLQRLQLPSALQVAPDNSIVLKSQIVNGSLSEVMNLPKDARVSLNLFSAKKPSVSMLWRRVIL